jgi:hypothetical protein
MLPLGKSSFRSSYFSSLIMVGSKPDMRLAIAIHEADSKTQLGILRCFCEESLQCRKRVKCYFRRDLPHVLEESGAESENKSEAGEGEREDQDEEQNEAGDDDEEDEDDEKDDEEEEALPRKKPKPNPAVAATHPAEDLKFNDRGVSSVRRARHPPNITWTERIWKTCLACNQRFDNLGERH